MYIRIPFYTQSTIYLYIANSHLLKFTYFIGYYKYYISGQNLSYNWEFWSMNIYVYAVGERSIKSNIYNFID